MASPLKRCGGSRERNADIILTTGGSCQAGAFRSPAAVGDRAEQPSAGQASRPSRCSGSLAHLFAVAWTTASSRVPPGMFGVPRSVLRAETARLCSRLPHWPQSLGQRGHSIATGSVSVWSEAGQAIASLWPFRQPVHRTAGCDRRGLPGTRPPRISADQSPCRRSSTPIDLGPPAASEQDMGLSDGPCYAVSQP
jgi:hypothetical protein